MKKIQSSFLKLQELPVPDYWLNRVRVGLPLTLFCVVIIFEVIEHFIASPTGFNSNFVIETFFFGIVGPSLVYMAMFWLIKLYRDRILATQQLKQLNEALRTKEELRRNLLHQIINAQEAERMRIARQLHDEFAQGLMAFMISVDGAAPYLETAPPSLLAEMQRARSLADEILLQTRSLMLDLRPAPLDELGLVAALRDLAARLLAPRGIQAEVTHSGKMIRLRKDEEITLYRIGQEAMNNALQHSGAKHVWVAVDYQPQQLMMSIKDDGCGFEPNRNSNIVEHRGWGLIGMEERINLLGGKLIIDSHPGQGTCIEVNLPIEEKKNA